MSSPRKYKLEGQTFGELYVKSYEGNSEYMCVCSCGACKKIRGNALRNNSIKTCGDYSVHNKHKYNDITGQRFGKLVVQQFVGSQGGRSYWNCKCDCGKVVKLQVASLLSGTRVDCGCTSGAKRKNTDLTGQTIGEWLVLKSAGMDANKNKYYLCRCSCGVERKVSASGLLSGRTKSCGHVKNKFIDLTGKQFGEWTVESYSHSSNRTTYWNCRCSCGVHAEIGSQSLRKGRTKSCGHIVREDLTEQQFGEWTVISMNALNSNLGTQECLCRCSCGTVRNVHIKNLITGKSKSCGHTIISSTAERDIADYIATLTPVVQNNRKLLDGKELDIYIPSINLGVEYNGIYWHSTLHHDKNYHKDKLLLANNKNIKLLQIFENEWTDIFTNTKLKSYLSFLVNGPAKRYYARKLAVQSVSKEDTEEFIRLNSLDKLEELDFAYGLYDNNVLVMLMTIKDRKSVV